MLRAAPPAGAAAAAAARLASRAAAAVRGARPAPAVRCAAPLPRAARAARLRTAAGLGQRVGHVKRETKETSVEIHIDLDGTGVCVAESGIPFLDHMLDVRPRAPAAARVRRACATRRGGVRRAGAR